MRTHLWAPGFSAPILFATGLVLPVTQNRLEKSGQTEALGPSAGIHLVLRALPPRVLSPGFRPHLLPSTEWVLGVGWHQVRSLGGQHFLTMELLFPFLCRQQTTAPNFG